MICITYTWRPVFALTTFDPTRHAPFVTTALDTTTGGGSPLHNVAFLVVMIMISFCKTVTPIEPHTLDDDVKCTRNRYANLETRWMMMAGAGIYPAHQEEHATL